jgi:L-seryl-tRNA(Ser) seleniumtransferase
VLVLNTLAAGREVVVSRGQLVEIGGSFRMPDVMAASNAVMREVGTTNRTHLRDYEAAVGGDTGAILHVHTSNYRVRGFADAPDIRELCALGRERGVAVVDDLGSGALVSLRPFGLEDEPLVAGSVAAGADLVCFSGDKLLCGPQSGIVCGRREAVARVRRNPLARAFRAGKLTLAALEATLAHFVNGDEYKRAIPFYRMLARTEAELEEAAARLVAALKEMPGVSAETAEDLSYVGSGSLPDQGLPTRVVRVRSASVRPEELARRLRTGLPSVFGRVKDDAVLLDLRTVLPDEVDELAGCVRAALRGEARP